MPATTEKVDLVIGVEAALQMEGQMEVQQGGWRTGTRGGAFLPPGFFPRGIGTEPCGAANGGVLALQFPVEHDLGGGMAADFFVGEEGDQTFLQGAKAAFNFAFGLGAGSDQMSYAQSGEGSLELRAGIAVIGHGVMAEEAQAVCVHHHGQAVLEKEATKMLEMIPCGVGGNEDRAQKLP